jgi:hypothetical protein
MQKLLLFSSILFCSQMLVAQNLIVDYNFDGNYDNQVSNLHHLDTMGNGNNFYLTEGSMTTDSALYVDGGQGLRSADSIDNSNWTSMAVSIWLKSPQTNQSASLNTIFQGAFWGPGIYLDANNNLYTFFDGSSATPLYATSTGNQTLQDGGWHHLLAQNDGDSTYIYIDGQVDTVMEESLFTLQSPNADAKIYLGCNRFGGSPSRGYIDEVKLYDAALSPNQIDLLYNTASINPSSSSAQNQMESSIQLFPNPTQNLLNIQSNGLDFNEIELTDLHGRTQRLEIAPNRQYQLDLSDYPAGLYVLRLYAEGKVIATQKFVKQKN